MPSSSSSSPSSSTGGAEVADVAAASAAAAALAAYKADKMNTNQQAANLESVNGKNGKKNKFSEYTQYCDSLAGEFIGTHFHAIPTVVGVKKTERWPDHALTMERLVIFYDDYLSNKKTKVKVKNSDLYAIRSLSGKTMGAYSTAFKQIRAQQELDTSKYSKVQWSMF